MTYMVTYAVPLGDGTNTKKRIVAVAHSLTELDQMLGNNGLPSRHSVESIEPIRGCDTVLLDQGDLDGLNSNRGYVLNKLLKKMGIPCVG